MWTAEALIQATVLAVVPALLVGPFDLFDVPWWIWPLLAVVLIAYVTVVPTWRYRVHRWEVTEDAVYTLEGWLSRTWRIVPVSRIQTVDTTRGPLQQLLGLTSVRVRTASHAGSTSIEQLPAPLAAAVAHDLGLRANQVRDEAT
jgi:uncharacterized protein